MNTPRTLPSGGYHPPRPDPSPEQIRQQCWEIQDGWDERTERLRAGCFAVEPIELVGLPYSEMAG